MPLRNDRSAARSIKQMSDYNPHVDELQRARDRELAQRREVAKAMAQQYEGIRAEEMRNDFIKIQATIEAIERAIAHEEYIVSKEPKSFWPQWLASEHRP
jgi:glycine betaine/choline ABC-type transport system substrate-binding protein